MAKVTEEIINLPTFTSKFVKIEKNDFINFEMSLHEFHQQNTKGLIVYFYPKDNTAGCSTQAQDFSAMNEQFATLGYIVIGISRDSVESHEKFIKNKQLLLSLISDSDEILCKHFDVIKEKNMYGKKTLGLVRSTFVFNADGKLTHSQRNLRAKGYAQRLLDVLR